MYNNCRSPYRSQWDPRSPNFRQDPTHTGRFFGVHRSPISSTPPFINERFPRYPQDSFYCSPPPLLGYPHYHVDSPARYGTPNFNQSFYHRNSNSSTSSYASANSSFVSSCCNPSLNMHLNSMSSNSFVTTQEDLSWRHDTSFVNSSLCDQRSSSPRSNNRKFGETMGAQLKIGLLPVYQILGKI
ncbi:unnamed protein product [Heterobilharzia americana]|nr:unnamed protein product [Heterobilharzia americana]